jgi:hypothetical protein
MTYSSAKEAFGEKPGEDSLGSEFPQYQEAQLSLQ